MKHVPNAVTLVPVTRDNWLDALELRVQPEQEPHVPSVSVALAKCYIRPEGGPVYPYAIMAAGEMVGFLTLTCEQGPVDNYWLNAFQIDRRYQRQGYGTAALWEVIALVRREYPASERFNLTVHPDNDPARRLYERAGFVDAGRVYDGEMVYTLPLNAAGDAAQKAHPERASEG